MWRPTLTLIRKVILPSIKESGGLTRFLYSTKSRKTSSTTKLTLVSASVGILIGAGYGGYTHYKINVKKPQSLIDHDEYVLLSNLPEYKAHYKVINEADNSNLQLVFFQYRTCPFCCKVRAYLDASGLSYEIVEVDAVLRQAIKWSKYKKVPILLAKVDGGYQQLLDSTAIISILESHVQEKSSQLQELLRYYPVSKYQSDGKYITEIANRYYIMHNKPYTDNTVRDAEMEEREWRQFADKVLVHTLSPNVYRTPSEALQTFKWFESAGGWRELFPAWECNLMVYGGATAMYFIAKRLKARHHIEDDVRQSLYSATKKWLSAVNKKGSRFHGGDQPDLADITIYGVLSSIEGCQAFEDLRHHTDVSKWYDDTKEYINHKRGKVIKV